MLALDVSPEVCFTSFASCGKGLFRHQVDAFYSPNYNRRQDPDLECIIGNRWYAALQKNPILHNNNKFRLARIGFNGGHMTLKLGTTNCCDFLGTNCLPRQQVQVWEEKGERELNDKAAFMANPLQLGALLHTNDDEYVFMRRIFLCCERRALNDRVVAIPSPEGVVRKTKRSQYGSVHAKWSSTGCHTISETIHIL